MVLGAMLGSLLASRAPLAVLAGIFGSVALLIAAKMLLPLDHLRVANDVPRGVGGATGGCLIGGVSAIMGIGGGTLAVPTLNLCGYPIHRAVGTAAFFGIFISIPGTLGYLLAQPPVELPWATVGFVSLVGLAVIAPGSMLTATLGARVAHSLEPATPVAGLRRVPAVRGRADALSRAGLTRCDWAAARVFFEHHVDGQHRHRAIETRQVRAQQVHLRHGELSADGDDARHALGERALARGMNLGTAPPAWHPAPPAQAGLPGTESISAAATCPSGPRDRRSVPACPRRSGIGPALRTARRPPAARSGSGTGGGSSIGLRQALLEHARHRESQHVAGCDRGREGARHGAQTLAIRRIHVVEQRAAGP